MKKSLILLSGLVAANVVTIQANTTPERPAFSVRAECFESLPGDGVTSESTEKGTSVRWSIRYPLRQNRVLAKRITAGLLGDTTSMSFWIRGDSRHELGLQLIQDDGSGFTKLIHVDSQWKQLHLPYTDFQSNEQRAQGVDPQRINRLVLVDYAATLTPQKRGRTIWLSDWRFAADRLTQA